jgi:hypothetical protein
MKKLVTAFAACALAGLVNAQVESVNIVGYTTTEVNSATWYQIASTFVPVGGLPTDGTPINDLFTTGFENGDKIFVWNKTTQSYDEYTWMDEPFDQDFNIAPAGWADAGEMRTEEVLLVGQAVFLRKASAGATTIVFAGQVEADITTTVPSATWVQVSLPYPVDVTLNDQILWTGFVNGDKVFVWNVATQSYDEYTWMDEPFDQDFNVAPAGWADAGEMRTDVALPVGGAMFIYKVSQGSGSFVLAP